MSIEHAIIHHLRREADTNATLALASDELPSEGYSEELFGKLKSGFLGRISREHGSFASDEPPSVLARALEAYLSGEVSFQKMSETVMEAFREALDERALVLDAHVLLFAEGGAGRQVIYLFAAGHKESLAIGERLQPQPSYTLDTGPSLFGIKIDLGEWKERKDYAYLSLLPPRGNPVLGDLFRELTGFSNGLDTSEATLTFLEGVESYSRQVPEEQVNTFRSQVVDYCMEQEQRDEPVDVRELAKTLDHVDQEAFVKVMVDHTPENTGEAILDRRSLRNYVKFAGREKDLAISFSSFQLNHRVHYDAENDKLSITGLPKALRKQLLGHLGEG